MTREGPRAIRERRYAVACGFVVFGALGSLTSGIEATTPGFRATYHLSPGSATLLVSAYNLGALSAMGLLCLRAGASRPRTPVFLACVIAGCAGMVLVRQLDVLIAIGVITGAGYGGLVVRINAFVARSFTGARTRMLNLVNATYGAGSVVGPVLAGMTVRLDILVCAGVLALCVGIRGVDRSHAAIPPTDADVNAAPFASVLPFAIIALLYSALETGIGSWGSADLEVLGYSVRSSAQLMGLFWCGLTLGRICAHVVADRIGAAAMLALCLCGCGVSIFMALIGPAAPAAYALVGLTVGPVLPNLIAVAAQRVPQLERATAALFLAEAAGNIAMPLLIGQLITGFSVFYLPFVVAADAGCAFWVSRTILRPLSPVRSSETCVPQETDGYAPARLRG